MSLIPFVGAAQKFNRDRGYRIERSLRFNSADSAYLNRTPASAGNRKTWTWSGWVKRSGLGLAGIFEGYSSATNQTSVAFNSTGTVFLQDYGGGSYNLLWESVALFRDPSAWYHIVITYDTTQASSANAVKVYVNGGSALSLTFTPILGSYLQNRDGFVNNTVSHAVGQYAAANHFSGYLTEINFIDGSALTPTSFGEFNEDTGVWQPKRYAGTYGTNGFYLNFSDNSGTTSTTLGKDQAGSNDWTPNNFSVTAGAGNDSLVDVPTRYGDDTGAGGEVRGNYCVLNPLNIGFSGTLSNGNLDYNLGSGTKRSEGTIAVLSGKWYWEALGVSGITNNTVGGRFGFQRPSTISSPESLEFSVYWHATDGLQKYVNASRTVISTGTNYGDGDLLSMALDADANIAYFYKNGSLAYTYNFSGDTSPGASLLTPQCWNASSGTPVWSYNFGQRPWAHTPPENYKALCTTNLPEPTIEDGGEYFNTVLYTGAGSTQTISDVGFQPDFVWVKSRSGAYSHALVDSVRGVSRPMRTNGTDAEYFESGNSVYQLNSSGFSVKEPAGFGSVNATGDTYVAWNWKAGGASVVNTDGTISSNVSVNPTAGFSIVTYTGNLTSGATVGHGLGVAPSMVIQKNRITTDEPWFVYHASLGATKFLRLNGTDAEATNSSIWNNTAPTSTVVTLGNNSGVNGSSQGCLLYCFAPVAGYSAAFSYTGNGSADGPFVFLNFRPALILAKVSSTSGSNWYLIDSVRGAFNVNDKLLNPNTSAVEEVYSQVDFLSNGFKIRNTGTGLNASGVTVIGFAWAENPFSYSLAR
jgi:hypothetical protein